MIMIMTYKLNDNDHVLYILNDNDHVLYIK